MKKLVIVTIVLFVSFLFSCTDIFGEYTNPVDPDAPNYQGYRTEDKPVTQITLTPADITIYPYEGPQQLSWTIEPSDTAYKNVVWSVSNPNVASVSSDGLVTPLGIGSTDVTIKSDQNGVGDSCSVVIKPYAELEIDETYTVTVTSSYWVQLPTVKGTTYTLSWADRQSGWEGCDAFVQLRPFSDPFGNSGLWDGYYYATEGSVADKEFTAKGSVTYLNIKTVDSDPANGGDFLLSYWVY